MPELREIKLSKLDPNPFRDGGGGTPPATWESVEKAYGYDEEKLKELGQSYEANGVWAGIHARAAGDRFQLAFGHHRVEAARRLGLASIPVIVAELSDSEMLKFMAAENSEEYGHDFSLGVLNAVEAVVKAYGAGAIELKQPDPKTPSPMLSLINGKKYTQSTVGAYLGWVSPGDGRPADKVRTAIQALELITLGALKRSQLKGLGAGQARELVTLTRRSMDAAAAEAEKDRASLEKQKAEAVRQDNRNFLRRVDQVMAKQEVDAKAKVLNAAKHTVSTVVQFRKESESFAEAARKTAEALKLPEKTKKAVQAPKVVNLSSLDPFINRLDSMLLEDDSRWHKILSLAESQGEKKTLKGLELSLLSLADRARARAKELNVAQKGKK